MLSHAMVGVSDLAESRNFYNTLYLDAVTIPAVLLLGISKGGFGTGFGSLAVPIMALVVAVPQAAAILMPVLLLMDLL